MATRAAVPTQGTAQCQSGNELLEVLRKRDCLSSARGSAECTLQPKYLEAEQTMLLAYKNLNMADYWQDSGTRSHITASAGKQSYELPTKCRQLCVKGPALLKLQSRGLTHTFPPGACSQKPPASITFHSCETQKPVRDGLGLHFF